MARQRQGRKVWEPHRLVLDEGECIPELLLKIRYLAVKDSQKETKKSVELPEIGTVVMRKTVSNGKKKTLISINGHRVDSKNFADSLDRGMVAALFGAKTAK